MPCFFSMVVAHPVGGMLHAPCSVKLGVSSADARMAHIERMLCDSADIHKRHEQWWKALQARVDQIHAEITTQASQVRQALRSEVREAVSKEREGWDIGHSCACPGRALHETSIKKVCPWPGLQPFSRSFVGTRALRIGFRPSSVS